jgi:hypothetical protein
VKKFALLTVVAALFAAPAFARQSMNMTGMENTVGVVFGNASAACSGRLRSATLRGKSRAL